MENNLENLTIGVFAKAAGVNVETIRFYQRKGLLLEPDKPYGSIRRYGVPHVFADSHYGLYYGYGYAVAQDRLFQMDMARRSFVGTTAAVLGPGDQDVYVKYDMQVRQNFTPASIQRQIAALSKDERDIFRGYADGYNAYLEQVRRRPELLPKEYVDFDFQPEPLTASSADGPTSWTGKPSCGF